MKSREATHEKNMGFLFFFACVCFLANPLDPMWRARALRALRALRPGLLPLGGADSMARGQDTTETGDEHP